MFGITTDDQVLAACLRVDGAVSRFAAELNPLDVGYVHGVKGKHELYKTLLSYHAATKLDIVDPVAWQSWLITESDLYEAIGGEGGYRQLLERLNAVELPTVDALVKLVAYRASQRRQLDSVQELHRAVSADQNEPGAKEKISQLAEQIQTHYNALDYNPLAKVRTAADIVASVDDLWDIPPFLPTPYKNLNRAMGYSDKGGFFRGGVHAILALSGHGKSTLIKNIVNYWVEVLKVTCLIVNFEEPQAHWDRILMTQMTGHNVYAEHDKLTSVEMADISRQFAQRVGPWGDRLMVRHDPDTVFFEDLETWLRDIMGSGAKKPDVVVIDTIQSLFKKTGGSARWGDYEYMMVRLEKLAKDMDAVFVITAQQNINSTKEKREVINQSDTGGSITIGQKSTVAMFITPQRGSQNGDDTVSDRIMEIQIPKNRITGTAFSESPPLLVYDDSVKSYFEYDPAVSDERYTTETVDLDTEEDY